MPGKDSGRGPTGPIESLISSICGASQRSVAGRSRQAPRAMQAEIEMLGAYAGHPSRNHGGVSDVRSPQRVAVPARAAAIVSRVGDALRDSRQSQADDDQPVPKYAEGEVRRGPLVSGAHFDGVGSKSHARIGQLAAWPEDVRTEAQGPGAIAGARVRRRAHWISAPRQRAEAAAPPSQQQGRA